MIKRYFTNFMFLMIAALTFTACNSEDNDYDIEYTAIHPLGGQYTCTITRNGETIQEGYNCYLANTSANDADKCWIRVGSYSASSTFCINGKISCDVKSLTFSGSNIENLAGNVASSTETFTLTDGKLELNGITTPSGTVTDKISFTYTTTKDPGATYTVTGWRYTGWEEDF